jgi:hypothetical protein
VLTEEARRLGVTCWVLEKAAVLYRLAGSLGTPQDDITRLAMHYEAWADVEIRTNTKEVNEPRR